MKKISFKDFVRMKPEKTCPVCGDTADPKSPVGYCELCEIDRLADEEEIKEELEASRARSLENRLFPHVSIEQYEAEHRRRRTQWFDTH